MPATHKERMDKLKRANKNIVSHLTKGALTGLVRSKAVQEAAKTGLSGNVAKAHPSVLRKKKR